MKSGKFSGFTLIEILVALAVFSILATLTASAMYYAFNTRSRISAQAERLLNLQLAISTIERDIAQAASRAVRGDNMQLFPAFTGQADYMELTRSGMANPGSLEKRSTLKRVALFCKNNKMTRRSWERLDLVNKAEFLDRVLLENVSRCQFTYLSSDLQFLSEWRGSLMPETKPSAETLPKGVQITLTLRDWGEMSLLFVLPEGLYA